MPRTLVRIRLGILDIATDLGDFHSEGPLAHTKRSFCNIVAQVGKPREA